MRPTETDKKIAERLKMYRNMKGLTIENMTLHLGVSYQQYHKYESGVNRITGATIKTICNVLNISSDELLDTSTVPLSKTDSVLVGLFRDFIKKLSAKKKEALAHGLRLWT